MWVNIDTCMMHEEGQLPMSPKGFFTLPWWTQTGAALCLQRTPARLLRNSHQGLERPPKTRLEKNSQRHGPGTLSVRVFEPQYWSEGVWQTKKTFPALKSFVCYKSWRTVLEAPDGHETNFWQPQKFILVDLESVLLPLHSRIVLYEFNSTTCLNHLNKLSSSQKVLFHGSLPSTCPKTAHTP